MSVNYNTNVLTSRLQKVIDAIDAGASNGWLRLLDPNFNVLSSFQLPRPMGVAAAGVLTFNGLSLIDPAAAARGTATQARVEDSSGTVVISGLLVNGSTPDILLTPTNEIVAGQTLAITAATIRGN